MIGVQGDISSDRTKYLTSMLLACAVLVTARSLHPSIRGLGTHEQLGLPPCPFFLLTGIPCPSCGLTTSFAHAARFHFYDAFIAQPFGLIVFCLTVLVLPIMSLLIWRSVPLNKVLRAPGANKFVYVLIALCFLSWVYKVIVMVR